MYGEFLNYANNFGYKLFPRCLVYTYRCISLIILCENKNSIAVSCDFK